MLFFYLSKNKNFKTGKHFTFKKEKLQFSKKNHNNIYFYLKTLVLYCIFITLSVKPVVKFWPKKENQI